MYNKYRDGKIMPMKTVKWKEIYKDLKEEIENGRYRRGDRFLRIKDICEKFEVSDITARRVLYELERENFIVQKQKVGAIIKSLKEEIYVFSPYGWNVKKLLGLEYIRSEILKGIIEESIKENLEVKFISERYLERNFNKNIFLILYHTLIPTIEKKLISVKNPNILFLHTSSKFDNVHTIRHDLYKGSYIVIEYLINKGYKKIGFISGFLNNEWFLPRFEGYISAIRGNKIKFDMKYIKETNGEKEVEDIKAFEELMDLPEPPDAIFCANDRRAIHILEYCNKNNIKVPEEIAICGFDNIPEAELTIPPLTTVNTKFKEIGEEGVKLAIRLYEERIEEIQDIVIEPELIERQTT